MAVRHSTINHAGQTPTSVTLSADVSQVAVLNRHATANVWVRVDGTDPEVDGDDTYVVPPGSRRVLEVTTAGATVVKLRADAGVTDVEVEVEG